MLHAWCWARHVELKGQEDLEVYIEKVCMHEEIWVITSSCTTCDQGKGPFNT